MRILVLQRESAAGRAIQKAFEVAYFAVDVVSSPGELLELAAVADPDAIILDLLPAENPILLQKIRKTGLRSPLVVFKGLKVAEERIRALEAGADDCVPATCSIHELVVRLRALLRRPVYPSKENLRVHNLELDQLRHTAFRNGKTIRLTPKEYAILQDLMRNAGRPVSRTTLVKGWNSRFEGVIDVYINRLRGKIDSGFDVKLIRTVRGVGYVLINPAEEADGTAA